MIGIDNHIDKANTKLSNSLSGIDALGRAYLVVKDNGDTLPEVQTAGTNQYEPVTPDSSLTGLCFFVVQNDYTIKESSYTNVNVDIYFHVDLTKLYPSVSERAVEYLHKDILKALKSTKFGVTGITSGYASWSDFGGFVKMGDDMQPYYLCKVQSEIEYNINNC